MMNTVSIYVYKPWTNTYQHLKVDFNMHILTICWFIDKTRKIDLIYRKNILLQGMPLCFYGVGNDAILYAIERKDMNKIEWYTHNDAPNKMSDIIEVNQVYARLQDLHMNKSASKPNFIRKYMKAIRVNNGKTNDKKKEDETKYEKPKEIISKSLPKFW